VVPRKLAAVQMKFPFLVPKKERVGPLNLIMELFTSPNKVYRLEGINIKEIEIKCFLI